MNESILEALQVQPLSEEEKSKRHILGRLWGPIATCKEKTRNGRRYNKELWEKALADELFHEKVNTKSLFLELGHPIDREETCMEKVCACIPEIPKIIGNELYACVDILDTANGRLLKTLCDYGFVPGISSRGSGELNADNEVDPETFFLETWDIVQLPAVKLARLNMCESLDAGKARLATALREAYNEKNSEEKKEMAETLKNLDVDIDLSEDKHLLPGGTPMNADDIPFGKDEEDNTVLLEDAESETEEVTADINVEADAAGEFDLDALDAEAEDLEDLLADDMSDEEVLASVEVEDEESTDNDDSIEDDSIEAETVADIIKSLEDYEGDLVVEFKPLVIEDKEYVVTGLAWDKDADDKVTAEIIIDVPAVEETITDEDTEDVDSDEEIKPVDSIEEEPQEDVEETEEEAEDNGADEVLESLKEALRQKNLLESETLALKNKVAVGDTKVAALTEELNKYKSAFERVSELAATSQKLKRENKKLNEQLDQKATTIAELKKTLSATRSTNVSLVESLKQTKADAANKTEVNRLTESLDSIRAELTATETRLNEELAKARTNLHNSVRTAKAYEAKYNEVLNSYLESKASMLGVQPSELRRSLKEGFSMADIDAAYENYLGSFKTSPRISNRGFGNPTGVRLNDRKVNGFEDIDDSLLELAGLK